MLAVEFLKFQNMFGVHAGLEEMNNHKLKCKKQPIEYDHDEQVRIKIEKERAEAEKKRIEEEERKEAELDA